MSIDFSTDKKPLTDFSLAGLADIVFLLLVFFLLTSSFIPQFGIQVNLPKTSTSAPTDAQYVTVIITSEGPARAVLLRSDFDQRNSVPRS